MTNEIADVIDDAAAHLTVCDQTGAEHAKWAREHGGKVIDAARKLLVRLDAADAEIAKWKNLVSLALQLAKIAKTAKNRKT
jgi:hypothetical protein